MIQPTTRSSFASTAWNTAGRAKHSVNAAKYGGPNIAIKVGSKVQFTDGTVVWDVARIFDDGTLYLTAMSSGMKRTRRVEPSSKSWSNLWMVDGKRTSVGREQQKATPTGGGPNHDIDAGQVITLGTSKVRWVVRSTLRDGSLVLASYNGSSVVNSEVGPKSRYWNSIYPVSR